MPRAGPGLSSRAGAHARWAELYDKRGDVPRARAHFGRALQYLEGVAFGADSYAEMMRKYTKFNVFAPPHGVTHFDGKQGERETYDRLMGMDGAEIHEHVIRADMFRAVSDLVNGRYSDQRPDGIHASSTRAGGGMTPIAMYGGELDGSKIQIFLFQAEGRIWVTAYTCGSRLYTEVKMQILSFDGTGSQGAFHAIFRGDAVGPADFAVLRDAATGTSDKRAVCVTRMDVETDVFNELPLRVMHAAVAVLAQIGVISGRSLVVIDKRGYGSSVRRWPGTLELGLTHSKYNYKLQRIGRHLVAAKADDLVNPLENADAHTRIRRAEIGLLYKRPRRDDAESLD
jgi:hypothetical protein